MNKLVCPVCGEPAFDTRARLAEDTPTWVASPGVEAVVGYVNQKVIGWLYYHKGSLDSGHPARICDQPVVKLVDLDVYLDA